MPDSPTSRLIGTLPTTARLSLGRREAFVGTEEQLRFELDHALARDAVHAGLDDKILLRGLRERSLESVVVRSAAPDRTTYLRLPDLGRMLHLKSTELLERRAAQPVEIVLIVADGLSALAVERHALALLDALLPLVGPMSSTLGPVAIATQARVALGDPIGQLLNAKMTIMLIGERPGLSAPDSLGAYITWNPQSGRTSDAERNCISNIRGTEGLGYAEAAHRIAHYVSEAHRLRATGIALKDPTGTPRLAE